MRRNGLPIQLVDMLHTPVRTREIIALVVGLPLILLGCRDAIGPDAFRTPRFATEHLVSSRQLKGLPDRDYIRVARTTPGFGGLLYDDEGYLTVALSRPADASAIQAAAEALLEEWGEPARIERTRVVDYDFAELSEWSDRFLTVYKALGANFLDVDEGRNRVVAGMLAITPEARERFNKAVETLGIPAAAILLEQRGPYFDAATLQDRQRPSMGGFVLRLSVLGQTANCALGPVVGKSDQPGALYFVTSHHCTRARTGVDGDIAYQNTIADTNRIGYEVADPAGYVHADESDCPIGKLCRKSDASLFEFYNPADGARGKIAHTMYSGTTTGSIELNGPGLSVFGGTKVFILNATHQKIGPVTGWTTGPLNEVCFTWGFDPDITYTCQMKATMGIDFGDSGAPVFRYDTYGRVLLAGVVKAKVGAEMLFSPITGVTADLGPLVVVP